jgi:putative chitinase
MGGGNANGGSAGAVRAVNPTALTDAGKFFQSVHAFFGSLTQPQVDGFNTLLQAFAVAAWPISWAAYGLATPWHETNEKMEPVEEAFFLGDKAGDVYRRKLRYFPHYGRGFAQLTWERNYRRADLALSLNGALVTNPDLAMEPEIAAKILVKGMEDGFFTGKALDDFLPAQGTAPQSQFERARRIINGTDKAPLIASYAIKFQVAWILSIGGVLGVGGSRRPGSLHISSAPRRSSALAASALWLPREDPMAGLCDRGARRLIAFLLISRSHWIDRAHAAMRRS